MAADPHSPTDTDTLEDIDAALTECGSLKPTDPATLTDWRQWVDYLLDRRTAATR